MSNPSNLKKISKNKRKYLKVKFELEDELEQIKQDKFYYKRKGDYTALQKANVKEKEIKNKLNSLENGIFPTEVHINQAKIEEPKINQNKERIRKQKEKEQKTKNQMNSILRLMMQGKSRSQAAQICGIPLSRVSHWVLEGKRGVKTYIHFYNEVTAIENDRERIKRQEINRQKRLEQEKEQKRKREQQKRSKAIQKENTIKKQMDSILTQMKHGKTRNQAAIHVGVSIKTVNEWYDKGFRGEGRNYIQFYQKVSTQEIKQKKEKKTVSKPKQNKTSNNMIVCPYCGNKYNKLYYLECPNCKKSNLPATVNYCQNCGKKINSHDSKYCSNCGSIIEYDNQSSDKKSNYTSNTSKNENPSDWNCCLAVLNVFIIFAFIGVLL